MCPQLLSRVKPNAMTTFGPESLGLRPKLAPYVATTIGIWSYSETEYASILTNLMQADFRIVHEMFHALKSTDARRQVLQAAAEETLNDQDLIIFNTVRKCTNASRIRRNDFAHCLWGTSDVLPDALLLVSPKYITKYDVHMAAILAGQKQSKDHDWNDWVNEHQVIYVFKKVDLKRDLEEALWAHSKIRMLAMCLSQPHAEGREQARNELLADRQIQACSASLSLENNHEFLQQSPPQAPT